MAQSQINYTNSGDYTFDSDQIEFVAGQAELKETTLWDGLLRYYKFDQSSWGVSASDVTNYAPSGPDISSFNSKPTKYGKIGRGAYQVLDNDVFIEAAPADFPYGNSPRTITMWVHPDQVATTQYTWAWGNTGVDKEFYGAIGAGGSVWVGRGSGNMVMTATGVVTANAWNLIIITFDGTLFDAYVNNVDEGGASRPSLNTTFGQPFYIGRRWTTPASGFHGKIGEVMIHDRVLTAAEREYIWTSGQGQQAQQYPGTNNIGSLTDIAAIYNMEDNVTDSSPMLNNGTATDITYAAGKVGQAGVFNGTSSNILVPSVWDSGADPVFDTSVAFWSRRDSTTGTERIFSYDSDGRYFRIEFDDLTQIQVHWTDGVGAQVMTYAIDPSTYAFYEVRVVDNGTCEIRVNNVQVATQASTTVQALLDDGIRIGSNRNGDASWFEGQIDQFVIKQGQFTTDERTTMYNAGAGGTLPGYTNSIIPKVYKTAGTADAGVHTWTGFQETASNGSIGYRLSDDGSTWKHWDGADWIVGSSTNSVSTVNANIVNFDASAKIIYAEANFVGTGSQKTAIDQNIVVFNTNPTVSAGADKGTSGNIKDDQSYQPFSDGSVTDTENNINLVEYTIDGGGRIEIPLGIFATYTDALQAVTLFGGTTGIGTHAFVLYATDTNGAESSDVCNVTIARSSVTVKDFTQEALDQLAPVISASVWGIQQAPYLTQNGTFGQYADYRISRIANIGGTFTKVSQKVEETINKKFNDSKDMFKLDHKALETALSKKTPSAAGMDDVMTGIAQLINNNKNVTDFAIDSARKEKSQRIKGKRDIAKNLTLKRKKKIAKKLLNSK